MNPLHAKPAGRMRLVVIPTRDVVDAFRQDMSVLSVTDYDMLEVGSVFVSSYDRQTPENLDQLRGVFSDHFATMQGDGDEYDYALPRYRTLYERLTRRMEGANFPKLSAPNYLGLTFSHWLGDDLVVMQHPLPY